MPGFTKSTIAWNSDSSFCIGVPERITRFSTLSSRSAFVVFAPADFNRCPSSQIIKPIFALLSSCTTVRSYARFLACLRRPGGAFSGRAYSLISDNQDLPMPASLNEALHALFALSGEYADPVFADPFIEFLFPVLVEEDKGHVQLLSAYAETRELTFTRVTGQTITAC